MSVISPSPVEKAPRVSLSATLASPTRTAWLGLGFLILGIALRLLVFGLHFPIWCDEAALSFNFVERDYRGLLRELNNWQIAPLLFLWIEKTVCILAGPSDWWLRMVPVVAGVGGLVLFWRLARIVLPPMAGVLAVGILAVSWWPIQLASFIKPYSIDLFVSALLLNLAVEFMRQPKARTILVALAVVAPLAVGLSYPSVFVAGAVSLVLALGMREKTWGDLGWFLAFNALLLTAFLAHLLFVGRETDPANPPGLDAYMMGFWRSGFPHGGPLVSLWWAVRVHFGKMFSYPLGFNGGGLMGLILLVLGARSLLREGQRQLVLLCLLPFALHLLAALLQRYPYGMHPRLEQDLAPCFCLLAGAGLAELIRKIGRTPVIQARWLLGATSCLAAVGIGVAVTVWREPYHDVAAQWARSVAQDIQQQMRPDDVILVRRSTASCDITLRWQLLAMANHIQDDAAAAFLERRTTTRLWILDATCDHLPVGALEPVAMPPSEPCDPVGTQGWQTVRHRRFRADLDRDQPIVSRFCCDVYLIEPSGRQGGP
jgi:Dolichyl-phosphate-mannose-protein mannosyltransferase